MNDKDFQSFLQQQTVSKTMSYDPDVEVIVSEIPKEYYFDGIEDFDIYGRTANRMSGQTIGQTMAICQTALGNNAPPSAVDQYCIDSFGVSYGYIVFIYNVLYALNTLGHSNYGWFLNLPTSNLA